MSLFKEKDDYIIKAFRSQFNDDSDSDSDVEKSPEKVQDGPQECKSEESFLTELTDDVLPGKQKSTIEHECIDLDCSRDSVDVPINEIIVEDENNLQDDDVICISSDDENRSTTPNASNSSFQPSPNVSARNSSQDMDDYDFNLKLTLAGSYKQFNTTYKTKLNESLKGLLSDISSKGRTLIITANEKTVSLEESPYTLKLKSGTILNAIEVIDPTASNPNGITVKLQDGNRKHTKEFTILKDEPLLKLKQLYAKEFKINSTDLIKFCFDGDVVDDESTAEELDIEDDCVIDVMLF